MNVQGQGDRTRKGLLYWVGKCDMRHGPFLQGALGEGITNTRFGAVSLEDHLLLQLPGLPLESCLQHSSSSN
jgi:hypothetical protein